MGNFQSFVANPFYVTILSMVCHSPYAGPERAARPTIVLETIVLLLN